MAKDIPFDTFPEELPKDPNIIQAFVDCENIGPMLHHLRGYQTTKITRWDSSGKTVQETLGGRTEELSFHSDEPVRLGGGNAYPQPLTLIAGGIGA